jgi:polysaccharide export outer membrane protein
LALGLFVAGVATSRAVEGPASADQQHLRPLGPGDSVSIQVFGQPDSTVVYVDDDGSISVPLAGKIPVAGLSPVAAADKVAKALKDGGYFLDPHVTVMVMKARGQLVSVVGEVQASGRYPVEPRTTIVDLLAQAGGLKETASHEGYVLRSDEDGHINRYPINLDGLTDLKDALPTPTLLDGDSLVVPRAERCFVAGEVVTPGTIRIEPGMTVLDAIARAGGVNERGSERRIVVKRRDKDGGYKTLHAKPGDLVQADDIIRVKESIF